MRSGVALIIVLAVAFIDSTANAANLLLAGFTADTVFKFDGTTTTPFATHPTMDGPTALVFDPAGDLLVLNEFSNNVLKFNGVTGAFIGTLIDTATIDAAGLHDAADMEIGPDGNLYLMSHFNNFFGDTREIHRFNATTGAYMGVFSSGRPFRHQHGLAFGPGGNLFQGNVADSTIEKFDGTSGAFLGTFASDAGLFPIADLAFSATTLYVTVHTGGIARFDAATGAFIDYLETAGGYWGLYVDGPLLYVSNLGSGSIRTYNSLTGAFISEAVIGGGAFDILPMPIPEPSTGALLALTAAPLLRRRART